MIFIHLLRALIYCNRTGYCFPTLGSGICAILRSRIGESGEFWEKVRESERERVRERREREGKRQKRRKKESARESLFLFPLSHSRSLALLPSLSFSLYFSLFLSLSCSLSFLIYAFGENDSGSTQDRRKSAKFCYPVSNEK